MEILTTFPSGYIMTFSKQKSTYLKLWFSDGIHDQDPHWAKLGMPSVCNWLLHWLNPRSHRGLFGHVLVFLWDYWIPQGRPKFSFTMWPPHLLQWQTSEWAHKDTENRSGNLTSCTQVQGKISMLLDAKFLSLLDFPTITGDCSIMIPSSITA